jgi:predicted nucleotidyltransferase
MTFFNSLPPNDLGHDFVVGDPRVFGLALHGTDTFTSDFELLVDPMERPV